MTTESNEDTQGAYQVVSFRLTWSGMSLFLLLLQLPMPYLVTFLPWRPHPVWLWPLVRPALLLVLSFLGFLCGLLGLRFSASRGAAKLGTLLNGIVLALMTLWVLAVLYILLWRR